MSSTNKNLAQTLIDFGQNYCREHKIHAGYLPIVEHDEDWVSPCELDLHDTNHKYWQPFEISNDENNANDESILSFANVESALDLELHPDIKTYFTTIFSHELEAECSEGQLSLLLAWNKDDFSRLQENIIGHILMKRRLKQDETVFFAVTDEEDLIISIINSTGEVWVERVGCKPHKKISNSLGEFIKQLTPKIK